VMIFTCDHLLVVNDMNVYPQDLLHVVYKNDRIQHADGKSFVNDNNLRKIRLVLYRREGSTVDANHFKQWWLVTYGTKFLPTAVDIKNHTEDSKLMRS
jgi:hypothetical protein